MYHNSKNSIDPSGDPGGTPGGPRAPWDGRSHTTVNTMNLYFSLYVCAYIYIYIYVYIYIYTRKGVERFSHRG